jgi:hypothetical protein
MTSRRFSFLTTFCTFLYALQVVNTSESCDADLQVCKEDISPSEVYDPISQDAVHLDKFLSDTVFNQAEGSSKTDFISVTREIKSANFQNTSDDTFDTFTNWSIGDTSDKESEAKLNEILGTAVMIGRPSRRIDQSWKLFSDFICNSTGQIKKALKGIKFNQFSPLGVLYYLESTDEIKNPSWKRRKHRFHKQVPINSIIDLHDALYLSQLAYADTVQEIQNGIANFRNNSHQLIYARPKGLPGEPSHFIVVKKEALVPNELLQSSLLLPKVEKKPLEVLIVVRGTKEFGDILTDTLLDETTFLNGTAHNGMAKAGEWLASEHLNLLSSLHIASRRSKLKLTLIGHSLGAGTAAIAAMRLKELDWLEVSSIGFGTPALLDLHQSQSVQNHILTIITDDDVVPRLSSNSIVNSILDTMSYDWAAKGLEDLKLALEHFNVPNKSLKLKWAETIIKRSIQQAIKEVSKDRSPPKLFPPGTCIHLYRDGVGFTASYTPCSFFDSIDLRRTMILDHMISSGYNQAFLELLRDSKNNWNLDFQHSLLKSKG